jgi:hypothetical protein
MAELANNTLRCTVLAATILLSPAGPVSADPVTQPVTGRFSDMFSGSPAGDMMGYVAITVFIAIGVLFWLFGSKFHRLAVTVMGLGGGMVIGWQLANIYNIDHPLLAMAIGAAIGASLGYWLFKLWLGLFTSALICLTLLALYSWQIAIPYLQDAENQQQIAMTRNRAIGLEEPTSRIGPNRENSKSTPTRTTDGQAYSDLKRHLRGLSPRSWQNTQEWRDNFGRETAALVKDMSFIVPHLEIGIAIILLVSLAIGMALVFLKTNFVNIVYTACLGSVMMGSAIAILLVLRSSPQSDWSWLQRRWWTLLIALVLMALVGSVLQFYLYGRTEQQEDDEGEEEPEPASSPKSDKGKKRKK